MNTQPGTRDAGARPSEPKPKAGPPSSAVEVENKLKEAQTSLMEAEGRLMAGAASSPNETPRSAERTQPKERRVNEEAQPNALRAPRQSEMSPRQERKREPVAKTAAKPEPPAGPLTERLNENVAGMLCYLLGWVSGLFFLVLDRRPNVRFHAAQSVAVFATLSILLLALSDFFLGSLVPSMAGIILVLSRIIELIWLVAAVWLMLKAAGGERYRVAIASRYGDRAAHEGR
jgi:uncharacterized membrane protein